MTLVPAGGNCTRGYMINRYLAGDHGGPRLPPPRTFDHFQFGVPTEMKSAARWFPGYNTYWGFDSFEGLPDEDQDGRRKATNRGWTKGSMSLACTTDLSYARTATGRCGGEVGIANAVAEMRRYLRGNRTRTRLVPGYYSATLTPELAQSARPAFYVDINCDLYVSTSQALRWLFGNGLMRPGSLIMYDDWFAAPFGEGESLAHTRAAKSFGVTFKLLYRCTGTPKTVSPLQRGGFMNNLVLFRVEAVGGASHDAGVVPALRHTKWTS